MEKFLRFIVDSKFFIFLYDYGVLLIFERDLGLGCNIFKDLGLKWKRNKVFLLFDYGMSNLKKLYYYIYKKKKGKMKNS